MDTITETPRPLEQALVFATAIYKGSQRFVHTVTETLSQLSPDQIKRSALVAGLTIESFIITDLTPYKGNPVLEAFRNNSQAAQVQIFEPAPDQIEINSDAQKISLNPEQNKSISIEDTIFKNFSAEERAATEKEIAAQIKVYEKAGNKLRTERVLDWENSTIKPILEQDVSNSEQSQFWSQLLSAIVYVESEGKALAKSEAGIVGLAQISEATAASTARKHGIFSFDLKKGWDSLRLGRFHLQDLMERFGEDISLLGYYGGQSFTNKNVLAALKRKGGPPDDSIIKNGISSDQQLRLYIDHYGINIFNLGSEDGEEYLTKTVAALRILRQAREVTAAQTKAGSL